MENNLNKKLLNAPHNLLVDIREKKYENKKILEVLEMPTMIDGKKNGL